MYFVAKYITWVKIRAAFYYLEKSYDLLLKKQVFDGQHSSNSSALLQQLY